MKYLIEVTDEQMDEMILEELKCQYECASLDYWSSGLKEDQEYNKKIAEALKLVLKHNMTEAQYEEYFNE